MFRTLLPPELRPANQTHKESCCCYLCVLASNYQSARSRFSLPVKKKLELETKKYELMDGVLPRNVTKAKGLALARLFTYTQDAFKEGLPKFPKPKDFVYTLQCPVPASLAGTGITKLDCALGICPRCPKFKLPEAEDGNEDLIRWHDFKRLPTCTKCGALREGTVACYKCPTRFKNKKQHGKIRTRLHLCFDEQPFSSGFIPLYKDLFKKYKYHRWKFLVLGKKRTVDMKIDSLQVGDVSLQHDFTEAHTIVHNCEVSALIFFSIVAGFLLIYCY